MSHDVEFSRARPAYHFVPVAVSVLGTLTVAGLMFGGIGAARAAILPPEREAPSVFQSGFGFASSFTAPTARGFALAHDGTNLWYAGTDVNSTVPYSIFRLDPTDGSALDSFPAPGLAVVLSLAHDGTYLYLSDNNFSISSPATIYVIDPAGGFVVDTYPDPGGPQGSTTGLVIFSGSLFVLDSEHLNLFELDPANGALLNTFTLAGIPGGSLRGLTQDGSNLIVYDNDGDRYWLVDAGTGAIVNSFSLPTSLPPNDFQQVTGLAFDGANLYSLEIPYASNLDAVVSVYSPQAKPVGGVAELPDIAGAPLEAAGSSGGNRGLLAGVLAAAATGAAIVLGGAAWFVTRRRRTT